MLISLLTKEFNLSLDKSVSTAYKIFSWVVKILLLVAEIALACFMVKTLDTKITDYSPVYGSLDFLVILLFMLFCVFTLYGLLKLRKSLYDRRDTYILSTLPVYDDKIVITKMLRCYASMSLDALFLCMPILITYGSTRSMNAIYYIFSFFYPFLVSLAAISVDLLLVSFHEIVYRFLKNKEILQFILASILMVGLCYLYKIFVELFLNCLSDSSIGNVFSDGFITMAHRLGKYLFPVANVIYPIFTGENALSYAIILIGFVLLLSFFGYIIATYCYGRLSKTDSISFNALSKKAERIRSVDAALIRKEINLIFRDSSSIFSYTSLLIMMPFLSYVVISSFNSIVFSNLSTIAALYPHLDDSIILCLIILFISTVNSSNSMLSKEKANIVTIKTLPISPVRMILIKAIVPLCLSLISLFASAITLLATGCISLELFLSSLAFGALYVVGTTFLGLEIEMRDREGKKTKLSGLYYYICLLLPVLLLAFDLTVDFLRLSSAWAYVAGALLYASTLIGAFICFHKRIRHSFDAMEINKA